jgi:hypothetical protein
MLLAIEPIGASTTDSAGCSLTPLTSQDRCAWTIRVGGSFNFYLADMPLGHAAITSISRGSTRSSMLFFLSDAAELPIELRTQRLLGPWVMLLCKTLLASRRALWRSTPTTRPTRQSRRAARATPRRPLEAFRFRQTRGCFCRRFARRVTRLDRGCQRQDGQAIVRDAWDTGRRWHEL